MLSYLDPPVADRPRIPYIRRLKAGQKFDGNICHPTPFWVMTHYSKGTGQIPCEAKRDREGNLMNPNGCRGCKSHASERLRGYLWAWNNLTKEMEWLEITPFAWDNITTQGGEHPDLKGYRLQLTRRAGGDRTGFMVELMEPQPSLQNTIWPKAPDVELAIRRTMQS